jgi:GWxTD domain-containing protein
MSGIGLPYFNTEIFPTFTRDGSQRILRVYIQILNDDITFIKSDSGFVAELQLDFYLADENKDFVFNKGEKKEIHVETFEETNSREIENTFSTDIPVDSGKYEAVITVGDKNSGKQVNRKVVFKVPSFSQLPFLVSDVIFFDKFETNKQSKIVNFTPNVTNNFSGNLTNIYLYFNTIVLDSNQTDSLEIEYTIRDPSNTINQSNRYFIKASQGFKEHFIRLNRHHFEGTRYTLTMTVTQNKRQYKTEKLFSFYWTLSPNSPTDLKLALEQTVYIGNSDSIDYYLKRPFEEKRKYFEKFWAEVDPNPETAKNELMDEYYKRLNYANRTFSTMSVEGWKTDRGRIFVKFGQPDDIERHPFETNSEPYEIWRYYSVRKVFLFIDRLGFGEYILHPSYLDEEFN